ncbi:MAG: hypothetical protein ACFB22_05635 [Rhodothalassiaceae bacterium]
MTRYVLLFSALALLAGCTKDPDGGYQPDPILSELARGACEGSAGCQVADPGAGIGRPCPGNQRRDPASDRCLPPSPHSR